MFSALIPSAYLTIPIRCCVASAPGVRIWEIAEVWRVILGKIVCRHKLTHHLQPVFVMEQASMQGEHEDARDDCSCHSSMLARGPERKGDKGWKVLARLCGFLRGKRRRTVWLGAVDLFLLGEMIKNNVFHCVSHLSNVPGPKPISKSLLFTGSSPYLLLPLPQPLLFFPFPEWFTHMLPLSCRFSHLDRSAVFRYTHWKGLGAGTSEMDPRFCHTLTMFVKNHA